MKKISLISLFLGLVILGGCSVIKSSNSIGPTGTQYKNDEICIQYSGNIQQKLKSNATGEKRSLDSIFYSPKLNSCIYSYIRTDSFVNDSGEIVNLKEYEISDLFANKLILDVSDSYKTAKDDWQTKKAELKTGNQLDKLGKRLADFSRYLNTSGENSLSNDQIFKKKEICYNHIDEINKDIIGNKDIQNLVLDDVFYSYLNDDCLYLVDGFYNTKAGIDTLTMRLIKYKNKKIIYSMDFDTEYGLGRVTMLKHFRGALEDVLKEVQGY